MEFLIVIGSLGNWLLQSWENSRRWAVGKQDICAPTSLYISYLRAAQISKYSAWYYGHIIVISTTPRITLDYLWANYCFGNSKYISCSMPLHFGVSIVNQIYYGFI